MHRRRAWILRPHPDSLKLPPPGGLQSQETGCLRPFFDRIYKIDRIVDEQAPFILSILLILSEILCLLIGH